MSGAGCEVVERFRRWYEYEKDVHARVLDSLEAVSRERRGEGFFREALDLMSHVVCARRLWLHRFGAAASGTGSGGLFPKDWTLERLASELSEMQEGWTAYLQTLDDEQIAKSFLYRSFEGQGYRNRIEDLLAQLYGHSWYHRGQVASLLRKNGYEPAVTDYVFWSRVEVDEEDAG